MKVWISFLTSIGLSNLAISPMVLAEFHDPMRPPAYALEKFNQEKNNNRPVNKASDKSIKTRPWELNSILYSSQRKHAIINNKLLKKGDMIRGAKLVHLSPHSVRLIAKGKAINLSLRNRYQSIRKSHNKKKYE